MNTINWFLWECDPALIYKKKRVLCSEQELKGDLIIVSRLHAAVMSVKKRLWDAVQIATLASVRNIFPNNSTRHVRKNK
jgi:hypothetical protein